MMKRIPDLFPQTERTYSFEFFPPKTDQGLAQLFETIGRLAALQPDYMTCTYGAGGGSRDKTFDIVQHIQERHGVPAVAHLTCVCHTREEIRALLTELKRRGIMNVLALRGDPPKDNPGWKPGPDNFQYSSEMVEFARKNFGGHFGIAVAGFPEGHPFSPDRDIDARHLKTKLDSGADWVITQLFFDNRDYFDYVRRLRQMGVTARVIPGILPVTDYAALLRFTRLCGASVTDEVKSIFAPIQGDAAQTVAEGIRFAIRQCRELLDGGAPGIHFYALNKLHPLDVILPAVRA